MYTAGQDAFYTRFWIMPLGGVVGPRARVWGFVRGGGKGWHARVVKESFRIQRGRKGLRVLEV